MAVNRQLNFMYANPPAEPADAVQAARERAEAIIQTTEEVLAMIVHDLRTSLLAILGWVAAPQPVGCEGSRPRAGQD